MCGLWDVPRNKIAVKIFIMIIFAYSAMKKRANGPAAYSTLKPETSSDSPSVKSNGARFVSASVEINHIIARGHAGIPMIYDLEEDSEFFYLIEEYLEGYSLYALIVNQGPIQEAEAVRYGMQVCGLVAYMHSE